METLTRGANAATLDCLIRRYGNTYLAEETIVRQGELSTEMYVVMDGEVEFLARDANGEDRRLGTGGVGTMFGEVSAFSGLARSATARAIGETMVLRLPREAALEMLRTSPEFALRIVQTLGQRLRDATLAEPVVAGSAAASPARRAFSLDEAMARLGAGTVRS